MHELYGPLEPLEPLGLQTGQDVASAVDEGVMIRQNGQDCPQMELEEVPDVALAVNEGVMVRQFPDALVSPVGKSYHDVRLPVCSDCWLGAFSYRDHPEKISPAKGFQFLPTRACCRVLRC